MIGFGQWKSRQEIPQVRNPVYGAYYKTHELDQPSFEELNKSLTLAKESNSTTCLLRDFNLLKNDWEHQQPR